MRAQERAVLGGLPTGLSVGGTWRPAEGAATFGVENPATGEELLRVADGSAADALDALAAAEAARADWAARAPRERGEVLRAAFEHMRARTDDLALLMTLELGRPLAESRAEVAYAAEFLRWYAEEAVRIAGRYQTAPLGGTRLLTMRQPVGPCVLVTPWNFPLAMPARKIAPALAAGCTAVLKPAEQAPLSSLALAGILADCGLPGGVLNVVTTSRPADVVTPLLADTRTRKLSFTGSTEVGRDLAARAARRVLCTSLELGGNAPFLVFGDADVDAAVEGALVAKLRNTGQACTAANRFLVAAPLAETFTARLAARMAALRVGPGTDPDVQVGPLVDRAQLDRVRALVAEARDGGARVRAGGTASDGPGWFHPPTVLDRVDPAARLLHEEIFGPVAPVTVFDGEDEAITAANGTDAGLVAYVYTRDLSRALRVTEQLEVGMVGLNRGLVSDAAAPFGGVKQSGLGREGGPEGLEEYLTLKYAAVDG